MWRLSFAAEEGLFAQHIESAVAQSRLAIWSTAIIQAAQSLGFMKPKNRDILKAMRINLLSHHAVFFSAHSAKKNQC